MIAPAPTLVILLVPALIPVALILGEFGIAPPLELTNVNPLLSITVPVAFTLLSLMSLESLTVSLLLVLSATTPMLLSVKFAATDSPPTILSC